MNQNPSTIFQAHVVPGVHRLAGQGHALAIETGDSVILVDTGPGGEQTAGMIASLRATTALPLSHIVYSHGHLGFNDGAAQWLADAAQRGHARPFIVAHEKLRDRHARYRETAGLQQRIRSLQARANLAVEFPPPADLACGDQLVLAFSRRSVVVLVAPSKTDDSVAVWLPAERFLYAGAAVIAGMPNVGSPQRTMRDPMQWAQTLERLHALRPQVVQGLAGPLVSDAAEIDALLLQPVAALRYLRHEVVARMNRGMHIDAIVHEVPLPEALFGGRHVRPEYGTPEFVMRDIWRLENGWWDRNPTSLHPAAPEVVAQDLRDAVGDSEDEQQHVLREAAQLAENGQMQLALHVLDLLAHGPAGDRGRMQALALKARVCRQRAAQAGSAVSRALYCSMAEELEGCPLGSTIAMDPAPLPPA